jgi:ABC-type uncharacterized transport system substrate-binding protein
MIRDQAWSGLVALVLASVSGISTAAAHPHAWIDLRTTVIVRSDGQITALEEEWLFDHLYTLLATQGLDKDPSGSSNALTELARTNLSNLRPYGYFINAVVDGAKVEVATVTEFETAVRDGRLWLRFLAPLVKSVDPKRQAFVFSVFDPSYVIEMLHLTDKPIAFRGAGGACRGDIQKPRPTAAALSLAPRWIKMPRPPNYSANSLQKR